MCTSKVKSWQSVRWSSPSRRRVKGFVVVYGVCNVYEEEEPVVILVFIGDRREDRPTLSWKEDPGELARRIFEWWKIRIHGVSNSDFIFFAIAIRLAILLQVSSCDVERVSCNG